VPKKRRFSRKNPTARTLLEGKACRTGSFFKKINFVEVFFNAFYLFLSLRGNKGEQPNAGEHRGISHASLKDARFTISIIMQKINIFTTRNPCSYGKNY